MKLLAAIIVGLAMISAAAHLNRRHDIMGYDVPHPLAERSIGGDIRMACYAPSGSGAFTVRTDGSVVHVFAATTGKPPFCTVARR